MVVVQPLLVATIVFSLPIARVVTKRRIRRTEWIGAITVAGGLAALLVVSKTDEGTDDALLGVWLAVGGACVGIASSSSSSRAGEIRRSVQGSSAPRRASCSGSRLR